MNLSKLIQEFLARRRAYREEVKNAKLAIVLASNATRDETHEDFWELFYEDDVKFNFLNIAWEPQIYATFDRRTGDVTFSSSEGFR